jgi:hypothetical protein
MNPLFQALSQTWPAMAVRSLYEAAKHPGEVYAGRADPMDVEKATDLAGLAMTGGLGGLGGMSKRGVVGSGPIPRQAIKPDGSVDLGWVFKDVEPGGLASLSREQNRARARATAENVYTEADLPIRSMIATQPKVNPDFASPRTARNDGYDLPAVFRAGGKLYVGDGHHRLAAVSEAADTARVRLFDLDELLNGPRVDPRQMALPFGKAR